MKLKNGFILRKAGEDYIVVATGTENSDTDGIVRLNDTGCFLWEKLQKDMSEKGLVLEMLREYEIDEATAEVDTHEFVETLKEAGLLE